MASNKVDLNIDIRESIGDYLPTVYVDFVDISYGQLPDWQATADDDESTDTEFGRYSTDKTGGTYVNGSLSIYFTRDKAETEDELEDWFENNFDHLWVYTFLCPFPSLNERVEKGVLNVRDLIEAMHPAKRNNFTSESPAFDAIFDEMKNAFLYDGFGGDTSVWRSKVEASESLLDSSVVANIEYPTMTSAEEEQAMIPDTDEFTTGYLESLMSTPGSWVYERFWGPDSRYGGQPGDAMRGPWTQSPTVDRAHYGDATLMGTRDRILSGQSFMEAYIKFTLGAYLGTDRTSGDYNYGTRMNAYRLADLASSTGTQKNLRILPTTDSTGDQITVLMNIPIDFAMTRQTADDINAIEDRLTSAKTIYLMAVVGLDVLKSTPEPGEFPGELTTAATKMNDTLFNANFGDITYMKIFESESGDSTNLTIADQSEEVFVLMGDTTPLSANPIMSINGTYHKSDPVNYQSVVSMMEGLVAKYADLIDTDRALRRNVGNLANILGNNNYTIDILRRLQFYRKTYVDKSTATTSGKLYKDFKQTLYALNRRVMQQPRAKKIRITNNKIIDSRFNTPMLSYAPPYGNGNCPSSMLAPGPGCKGYDSMGNRESLSSTAGMLPDNIYIPRNWHYMSRRTMFTVPIEGRGLAGEMAQFLIEEGFPTLQPWGGEETALTTAGMIDAVEDADDAVWWADYVDSYMGRMENAFENYYNEFLDGRMTGVGFHSLGEDGADYSWAGSGTDGETGDRTQSARGDHSMPYQDTVVENKGIFFFDYEKALNSHSMLSFVLTPWKIQRYLGMHVPYDMYRVKSVTMKRKESKFLTHNDESGILDMYDDHLDPSKGSGDPLTNGEVEIEQRLTLRNDLTYPFPDKSTYSGYIDSEGQDYYRYGQPTVKLAGSAVGTDLTYTSNIDFIENYSRDSTYKIDKGTLIRETSGVDYYTGLTLDPGMGGGSAGTGHYMDTSAREASEISRALAAYNATAPADDTSDERAYLTMINFDVPLGVRDGEWNSKPYADPEDRSSGRLENYEGWVVRGGYRTMCFEYRDFMDDDVAYYNTIGRSEWYHSLNEGIDSAGMKSSEIADATDFAESRLNNPTVYDIEIEVEDTSLRMMEEIYKLFSDAYDKFERHYYNLAIASCSFNNIDDQFNDFFREGIKKEFPNSEDRQWIKAPYMLNLGRQLFFGTYATAEFDTTADNVKDIFDAITDQSAKTAQLIGPDDGRLVHLDKFKIDYEKFLNIIRPRFESSTTTMSGRRLFGTKEGEHSHGEYDSPYFHYHPVYDRILEVSGDTDLPGETYDTMSEIQNKWNTAIQTTKNYTFENTFRISEPIYGDMFLSNLYAWNYTPPNIATSIHPDLIAWLRDIEMILTPATWLRSEAGGDHPDVSIPIPLKGFMEGNVLTERGWTARTHFGDNQVFQVLGGGSMPGVCVPPQYVPDGSPGWPTAPDVDTIDPDNWEAWIDQILACCFITHFGAFVAASMGVQYSSIRSPWSMIMESGPIVSSDGTDDIWGTGWMDAHGFFDALYGTHASGVHEGSDSKQYLCQYSLSEIADHITQAIADDAYDGDYEAAMAEIGPGIALLNRVSELWMGHWSGLPGPYGSPGTGSVKYKEVLFDLNGSNPKASPIWSDQFLWAVRWIMNPTLCVKDFEGWTDEIHIDSASDGGGAIVSSTTKRWKWRWSQPTITYKDIARFGTSWQQNIDVMSARRWARTPWRIVTTYLPYGFGGIIQPGWHYGPLWPITDYDTFKDIEDGGWDFPEWNDGRIIEGTITRTPVHPYFYQKEAGATSSGGRFPQGFHEPQLLDTETTVREFDTSTDDVAAAEEEAEGSDTSASWTMSDGSSGFSAWADSSEEDKIICAELFRQGLMERSIYEADEGFGAIVRETRPRLMRGYTIFASPIVKMMQRSSLFTRVVEVVTKPWTIEMAHQMGVLEKGSFLGKIVMISGTALCLLIDRIVPKTNKNTIYKEGQNKNHGKKTKNSG